MFGRVIFFAIVVRGAGAARVHPSCWIVCPRRRLLPPLARRTASRPRRPAPEPPQRQSSGYREALLEADQRGQYAAEVLINGVPVRMLIDTGASEVCVSASTARRLGLSPSGGRKRVIQTANGLSTADPTILRSLSLDGLYMNDVEALILAPEAGEVNLLGESFLKRLMSVEQRNGMLILRQ